MEEPGKIKCAILREIRVQFAIEHGIPFSPTKCTHKGDCSGTCPACDSELKYLNSYFRNAQKLT